MGSLFGKKPKMPEPTTPDYAKATGNILDVYESTTPRVQEFERMARKGYGALNLGDISGAMFGIESLNYEANKSVGKGIKLDKILEIGKILLEEWGDEVSMDSQYIIGLPNDGEKEINEWLDIVLSEDFPIRASQIFPLH